MSTIKISELATNAISLTDFFAKADASGLANKNTVQGLSNFLNTVGTLAYRGVLLAADAAVTLDGIYVAGDAGTYTNNGGLVITVNDQIVLISITGTQTVFEKVEIPITLTIDAVPTPSSINAIESGGVFDYVKQGEYFRTSYRINESASAISNTGINLLSTELLPKGFIRSIKINIATIGNLKFACFRKLETLKYQLIKQFDYDITITGVQTLTLNEEVTEEFYFGVVNGSIAQFNTEAANVGDPFNLNFFIGSFVDSSLWTESTGRTTNIEINVLKSEFVGYVNSLNKTTFDNLDNVNASTMKAVSDYIANQIDTNILTSSFPYNNSYSSPANTSLNLTTSESLPKGVVKKITLKANTAGIGRFAFLRQLTTSPTYKAVKYFECSLIVGKNIIDINEFIDEDFHFCILAGSASIDTADGTVTTDSVNLHFYNGDFLDANVWGVSNGRGNNIQVEIDTNIFNFPTKKTGKSITLIGDSITDFCDSTSSNGVQYIGFDTAINRYINFKQIINEGYSGIELAGSIGFANTKVVGLVATDYYNIYLGTNDLAFPSILGSESDYNNSTGVNTFYGAYRVLIDAIYALNPLAKIVLFTPNHRNYAGLNSWNSINANGNTLEQFADATRYVSKSNALYLVDLLKYAQVNRNNFNLTTYDSLHPNTRGYQEIAESFITELYNKF